MIGLVIVCWRCDGSRWVCESHPKRPWEGEQACGCGAPGVSCPLCNPSDRLKFHGCRRALSTTRTAVRGIETGGCRNVLADEGWRIIATRCTLQFCPK